MGKSAPSAPKAPDPVKTAQAQTQSNKETARTVAALNRVNQYTPYGDIEYTSLPGDRWSAEINLSPEQRAIYEQQTAGKLAYGQIGNQALSNLRGNVGSALNTSGLPGLSTGMEARDQAYNALMARIQPQLTAQREALDTRLRNQGITPGSEAWTKAMQEYAITENDARLAAAAQSGQEQVAQYGMSADAYQKALQQELLSRAVPLNEVQAMLGGAQVSYPQFQGVPQTGMANTDIAGITQNSYNNQMQAYNAQLQQQSGLYSGLGQLGGALLGGIFSDRRMKENVQKIGETDNDLPLYLFNYKGDPQRTPHISVMAQDVEKRDPGAVKEVGGMKAVDLARAVMASKSRKQRAA